MTDHKEQFLNKLIPAIEIRQGGIYKIPDDPQNPIIKFPTNNLPENHPQRARAYHKQRYVLVIQDDKLNKNLSFHYVQVIPLSSRGTETPLTVEIPDEFLSQEIPGPSYALVYLCQPVLKIFLEQEVGYISPSHDIFTTIRAIYLKIVGLI
jgi:mRNA-degrading endonuclease toxin of MazEF toxin-antitoxin module